MIPLVNVERGTSEKLFARLHRRMLDIGHPTPPWARLEALSPAARTEWAARAASEYRSMVVVGELIARFPEVGLPLEVTGAAARILLDEARHTELCARVAGGDIAVE